jgi:hypothetical protein
VLIDASTGCAVTCGPESSVKLDLIVLDGDFNDEDDDGPESSVKLDLIVLDGDFNDEDDDNWTREKFESRVIKERETTSNWGSASDTERRCWNFRRPDIY